MNKDFENIVKYKHTINEETKNSFITQFQKEIKKLKKEIKDKTFVIKKLTENEN